MSSARLSLDTADEPGLHEYQCYWCKTKIKATRPPQHCGEEMEPVKAY